MSSQTCFNNKLGIFFFIFKFNSILKFKSKFDTKTKTKCIKLKILRQSVWKMSEWSDCDNYCMGTMYRQAICIDRSSRMEMSSVFCDTFNRPMDEYRTCNTDCILG